MVHHCDERCDGRLTWVRAWEPRALTVIGEEVWWVTIVDATLVRHHPDAYDGVLAGQFPAERRLIEGVLAGLRFVRNRIGPDVDLANLVDPRGQPSRSGRWPHHSLDMDVGARGRPFIAVSSPDQCNDIHGGVNHAIAGHPETPCPFGATNDDPNDVHLKHNADAFVHAAVTTIMYSRAWTRHSAIFIVADEGDFTGVAANGGWDSPAGCCDSPVLPAGDYERVPQPLN